MFCNRLVYFFAIWFIVYFFSLIFLFFGLFLVLFEDILRQVSAVFTVMIYVWLRRFKENLSKILDSLLFSASLFQQIVLPRRISTLQPLTCHIIYFFNARPYLGFETEILIRDMVCSDSDEESARNPNNVSISPCAYLKVQGTNSFKCNEGNVI